MKRIKIGTHDVEYYDAIDELSVVRFHKWQKFVMIDSGIGADIQSFDQHIEKARRYCMTGKNDLAEKELMNLRQCVYFIQQELSPAHMAFAALVKSIDGKNCDDISDDALRDVAALFANMPNKDLTDHMDSVKKKIDGELMLYFPRLFADSEVKEYYDIMRQRLLAILRGIIDGQPAPDEIPEVEELTNKIILYSNPKNFAGSDSIEIQFDKNFENLCLVLAHNLNIDAKTKTVMEFYNAFEYLKDKAKQGEKMAPNRP